MRHPVADVVGIQVVRFLIMLGTLEVASLVGVRGWYLGLVTNIAVTVFAVVLMTRRGLWRSSGATVAWRSWVALAAVVPLVFEAVSWLIPGGLSEQYPGFLLWGTTLLLVGVNEELISRGVVLSRLREAYRPSYAVGLTAVLFGLQHLSAFALTSRSTGDILGNVALSAIAGFAWTAFQWRFRWIWPLIIVHATADFTTVLASEPLPDLFIGIAHALLLAFGILLLRRPMKAAVPSDSGSSARAGP